MFVDLPHFLPALKFQSLTGMVDVKCMVVVLISACVDDDVVEGWGRRAREHFQKLEAFSLPYSGGMLCRSDRVVYPSVCECPFA